MVTNYTDSALQKTTELLNQTGTEKSGCSQSSESKQQGQEVAEILDTIKQQKSG